MIALIALICADDKKMLGAWIVISPGRHQQCMTSLDFDSHQLLAKGLEYPIYILMILDEVRVLIGIFNLQ